MKNCIVFSYLFLCDDVSVSFDIFPSFLPIYAIPVQIEPPSVNYATYEDALKLRQECISLGADPRTGPVKDVNERCEIYRRRIEERKEVLKNALEAQLRNESRHITHAIEKQSVQSLSIDMIQKQISDACHENDYQRVLNFMRKGRDPNIETVRGVTPLTCAIINHAPLEVIEELLQRKADPNHMNVFGLTPLVLVCRLRESKLVFNLVKFGALIDFRIPDVGGGNTALHWCAIHGCEEEVRVLLDSITRNGEKDVTRINRFLDMQNDQGNTALMLAALRRNGSMCRLLITLGANTNLRNKQNRTAAIIARSAGWTHLAEWLGKKTGPGSVTMMDTYSDLQYDRAVRYSALQARELIQSFGTVYLSLVQGTTSHQIHPIGPPSLSQRIIKENGVNGRNKLIYLSEAHYQLFILNDFEAADKKFHVKDELEGVKNHKQTGSPSQLFEALHDKMANILNLVKEGNVASDVETPLKPVAWTPLMCAVVLNDVITIRRLVREGADVNYPNCQGTTPIMLAAFLNNVEALVELLISMHARLDSVDNEGFNALAYATALPLPQEMEKTFHYMMVDGEALPVRRLSAEDILRRAVAHGTRGLKETLDKNKEDTSPEARAIHEEIMNLMTKRGLSVLDSDWRAKKSMKALSWRLPEPTQEELHPFRHPSHPSTSVSNLVTTQDDSKPLSDEDTDDEGNSEDNDLANEFRKKSKTRSKRVDTSLLEPPLRCPKCTLPVPCTHFYTRERLKRFLQKKNEEMLNDVKPKNSSVFTSVQVESEIETVEGVASESTMQTVNILDSPIIQYLNKQKSKKKKKQQELIANPLSDIELDNRDKDRSLELIHRYRGRVHELMKLSRDQGLLKPSESEEISGRGAISQNNLSHINHKKVSEGNRDDKEHNHPENSNITSVDSKGEGLISKHSTSVMKESLKPSHSHKLDIDHGEGSILKLHLDLEVDDEKYQEINKFLAAVTASGDENPSPVPSSVTGETGTELSQETDPLISSEASSSGQPLMNENQSGVSTVTAERMVNVGEEPLSDTTEISVQSAEEEEGGNVMTSPRFEPVDTRVAVPEKSILKKNSSPTASSSKKKKKAIKYTSTLEDGSTGDSLPKSKRRVRFESDGLSEVEENGDSDLKAFNVENVISTEISVSNQNFIDDSLVKVNPTDNQTLVTAIDSAATQSPTMDQSNVSAVSDEIERQIRREQELVIEASSFSHLRIASPIGNANVGPNPVPISKRGVIRFTDGIFDNNMKSENWNRKNRLVIDEQPSEYSKEFWIDLTVLEPLQISGWLFLGYENNTSLSNHNRPPIEILRIHHDSWGNMLETVTNTFLNSWLPQLKIYPLYGQFSGKNRKCVVCQIGYVRWKDDAFDTQSSSTNRNEEDPDNINNLCLPCVVRRELSVELIRRNPNLFHGYSESYLKWPFTRIEVPRKMKLLASDSSIHSGKVSLPDQADEAKSMLEQSDDPLDTSYIASEGSHNSSNIASKQASLSWIQSQNTTSSPPITTLTPSSPTGSTSSDVSLFTQESSRMEYTQDPNPLESRRLYEAIDEVEEGDTAEESGRHRLGKKCPELTVVPFAICNGQFMEAERVLRVALGSLVARQVEDKSFVLFRALSLQADMYKFMGIWILALSCCLDALELILSVVGYDDVRSMRCISLVMNYLRQIGQEEVANELFHHIIKHLSMPPIHPQRRLLIKKIESFSRQQNRHLLHLANIWTVIRDRAPSGSEFMEQKFYAFGLGGLANMMSSTSGFHEGLKREFLAYCVVADIYTFGMISQFLIHVFNIRNCDDEEIYRELVRKLIQKYKLTTPNHHITRNFNRQTDKNNDNNNNSNHSINIISQIYESTVKLKDRERVLEFLKLGNHLDMTMFDNMLISCMMRLQRRFQTFVLLKLQLMMRRNEWNTQISEVLHMSVLMLQSKWRIYRAKRILDNLRQDTKTK